jgi:lipoprotein-anchoring transpeptidase ErfK/SrfK
VHLLHQTAVAYQDTAPAHLAIVSTGSPGWETPVGLHYIQERVADETMDGSTLNHLTMDAWHAARTSYKLDHVLYTQYIDGLGDALHDNYWLPTTRFGIPHSHGCVGMQLADAQWFWNWADYGVPVLIRTT